MANKVLVWVCVEPTLGLIETWERADGGWARSLLVGFRTELEHYYYDEHFGRLQFECVTLCDWFAAGPEENGREVMGEL